MPPRKLFFVESKAFSAWAGFHLLRRDQKTVPTAMCVGYDAVGALMALLSLVSKSLLQEDFFDTVL